jgi:FMN-dependent oxidoreductase (nitrilotriacetate monooxygenase family)
MTASQMHLGVFAVGSGNHIAGWRHPGASKTGADISTFLEIGRTAERGKLDLMFLADNVQCSTDDHPGFMSRLEPFSTLSAVSAVTEHVGLVASGSTSFAEPYNLARLISSLDHISNGRAGWNIVTTSTPASAANFGREIHSHKQRYEMAAEYVEVVRGLWDSWEPDAIVANVDTGQFVDADKVHALNFSGEHYCVKGPLNLSRSPQGQPVIVQAGSSETGQSFAARYAEVVLTVQIDVEVAREFYAGVKEGVLDQGRDPQHCKILPGLLPVVGGTEQEAREKFNTLASYIDESSALQTMSDRIGHDLSSYPLDGPVPNLPLPEHIQGYARMMLTKEYRDNHTLRDLYNLFAVSRGYSVCCGSPEQVADMMQDWFTREACDGFILVPAHFPEALDDFVDAVVPILQQRGLFREEYKGVTLRNHLGLPEPKNRYT